MLFLLGFFVNKNTKYYVRILSYICVKIMKEKSSKIPLKSNLKSSNSRQNLKSEVSDFANASTKKKIGFFSAMLVVVGSCIGSGIFFKAQSVLNGSQNSIILAMFCWVFVAFATLCMALALVEIVSARNDNLSLIGWCKTFNSRLVYKFSKNYMFYLYTPIKGFFLPVYMIMSFQDAIAALYIQKGMPYTGFGTSADWTIVMVIAIAIAIYFNITCGYSIKIGNIQNWIITSVKFLPLILAAIIGFVIFGMNGNSLPAGSNFAPGFEQWNPSTMPANQFYTFKVLPGLGFFIAASAILYAYDGFYGAAGIKTEMKEPQKAPMAIVFGLVLTTVIYLIIAISMSLGSTAGNPQGLVHFFAKHNLIWLFAIFQIFIGIGIMGVTNGYSMFATRFVEDLVRDGELPFSKTGAKYLAKNNRLVGATYCLIITIPTIVLFCVIGSFYINTSDTGNGVLFSNFAALENTPIYNTINASSYKDVLVIDGSIWYTYGTGIGKLYTFCDMVSNWSALFIFLFITLALIGGLKNRKTNNVQVTKFKYFKPMAWISAISIAIPIIFTIAEPFVNLIFLAKIPTNSPNYIDEVLVPRIMALVMLVFYACFATLPTFIEDKLGTKKYGSIEKYEHEKLKAIDIIMHKQINSDSNSDAQQK